MITRPFRRAESASLPSAVPEPAARVDEAVEREEEARFAPLDPRLVSLVAATSFEAEQYLILRHIVEQRAKQTGLRVLAVTSPGGGDGKTTTAINLAGAMARDLQGRILLIDADLRRPTLIQRLGLGHTDSRGLVDAILDTKLSLADVVRVRRRYNLAAVASGPPPIAPYELLKSDRLGDLIAEARATYDYVILDTPPVVPCPDYRLIEKWVDGVLIVVAAHKTPRRMVEATVGLVNPERALGIVFNGDDHPGARYRYGYSYSRRPY
jgi:succinoglycan biosynthesis transport protein ExoP